MNKQLVGQIFSHDKMHKGQITAIQGKWGVCASVWIGDVLIMRDKPFTNVNDALTFLKSSLWGIKNG